jgi:ubiquinone/menaquinone biosynthesis C-methylase UbiE
MEIEKLYRSRFDERDRQRKNKIWEILCRYFFQKYIPKDSIVLDIGAGYCEFINHIQCRVKYAVDPNADTSNFANADVKVFNTSSANLSFLSDDSVDIVFVSNFLEHLKTKEEVIKTLSEVFRVLKSGGGIMILQPNIRYLYREYWDFFDHHVPLSDKSLIEALKMVGFRIEQVLSKFLPYSTKSKIPQNPLLIKLYLKIPFVWKIMGKQMFMIARKDAKSE